MNLAKTLTTVLFALALAACSSDPKELVDAGYEALNSGRSADALAKFDEALGSLKPEDALYVDAKLGVVESLISGEPKKAADEFLALSKEQPERVGEKQFVYISGKMVSARKYMEAIDLVHDGIKRAGGESPELMAQIELIKKNAANDKGVNDKLRSLGYL
jgi:hypothetical protein